MLIEVTRILLTITLSVTALAIPLLWGAGLL